MVNTIETQSKEFILELKNITKTFLGGKIIANDNISLSFKKNEIHALVGENGSGKSTLMNIIFGLYKQDKGDIFINKNIVNMYQSGSSKKYNIGMVHQHFHIVENFTVLENVILGQEGKTDFFGKIDNKKILDKYKRITKKYNINLDPNVKASKLPIGQRQMIEILKVLWKSKQIIVFDEPTATLSVKEIQDLIKTIFSLKKEGKTIIFISHKLKEVKELADTISILRKGNMIGTHINNSKLNIEILAKEMIGKKIQLSYPTKKVSDKILLKINNLSYITSKGFRALNDVSFDIKEGEIFGLAGIEGNGQEQIIQTIVGLRKPTEGNILFKDETIINANGEKMNTHIRNSLFSHIPINRFSHGIVKEKSLKFNSILSTFDSPEFSKYWRVKTNSNLIKSIVKLTKKERKLIDFELFLLKQEKISFKEKVKHNKLKINVLLQKSNVSKETKQENNNNLLNEKKLLKTIENFSKEINSLKEMTDSDIASFFSLDEKKIKKHDIQNKYYFNRLLNENDGSSMLLENSQTNNWTSKIIRELKVDGAYSNSIPIKNLSGGNQQKFVVGREILKPHKLLIAGHPTRGLDISAIDHIYKKMIDNSQGKSTLLYSLEISELIEVCDRIAIMYKGEIIDIINPKKTSMEKISKLMIGQVN
ncbi:MAG: ATP-binding cassette domain-containing protein [Mycoplasmataceae bacterium]|nr:ATP-binding cassette domain-containing protein [Mycoplasmataceae bacterium]